MRIVCLSCLSRYLGYFIDAKTCLEIAEMTPPTVPDAMFYTRERIVDQSGQNPFKWRELSSSDVFKGKRVVLFALPGAFTPACSESHLPGYEEHYDAFIEQGIDQVVCLAVNDAFVMFQWAKSQNIQRLFMLPDGNGEFSRKMGMLVDRSAQGMGLRSWRYSMLVESMVITKLFAEPGLCDNPAGVPMTVSSAETMLDYLQQR